MSASTSEAKVEIAKKGSDDAPVTLPPPPQEPGPEDCCQSGCVACVWDIYLEARKEWDARKEELEQQHTVKVTEPRQQLLEAMRAAEDYSKPPASSTKDAVAADKQRASGHRDVATAPGVVQGAAPEAVPGKGQEG